MTWKPCAEPHVGDVIRWKEPIWAPPNKKRGKPDNIGEQLVTAAVVVISEFVELKVQDVEILTLDEGGVFDPLNIKKDDTIRRKPSTIKRGECERMK